MPTKRAPKRRAAKQTPIYNFKFRSHTFSVLLDDVLIFRFFRRLHGRFWGLTGILGLTFGLFVCFLIRPDMVHYSTAFSDFGLDVRTAPFFVLSVLFAAYGLWRWRNYLSRTLKRRQPILTLITFTILGLYMVALFPVSWQPWPYKLHFIGVTIVGITMAATVVFDILLSKTRKNQDSYRTRLIKMIAFFSILIGGFFTFGSSSVIGWFQIALIGELWMLFGYGTWIALKTFQGEDPRSALSRQLKRIVLID